MDIKTARSLVELLKSASSAQNEYVVKILAEATDTFAGFHQWVDERPVEAVFQVIHAASKQCLHLLVMPWGTRGDGPYFVVYPAESNKGPLVEIHEVVGKGLNRSLRWSYSPTKRDGRNPERKGYFATNFQSTDVQISLPSTSSEMTDFLDEVFTLIENRLRADALDPHPPVERVGFPEGRRVYRMHLARERSSKLVSAVKAKVLAETGALCCEACEFDFAAIYGEVGQGYIEAHHLVPLAELEVGTISQIEDLALLCANCHRMAHRVRPWLSRSALSTLVSVPMSQTNSSGHSDKSRSSAVASTRAPHSWGHGRH